MKEDQKDRWRKKGQWTKTLNATRRDVLMMRLEREPETPNPLLKGRFSLQMLEGGEGGAAQRRGRSWLVII